MKLKDYLNSLVSRRKSSTPSKPSKSKPHHSSVSSADCHYEICESDDTNKHPIDDQHTRTQILLARHAQLVNTIVGIRSQESPCPLCPPIHSSEQKTFFLNPNYSNTLATCNPTTHLSSSNNSLWIKTRQRSKIRTNPWIKTTPISQPPEPILSSTLIHSESFPQTISNGNLNPSNIVLHQSDSGHGFSLSSSRIIDSSSPDNTSNDGPLLDEKKHRYPPKTIPYDHKRRIKKPIKQNSHSRSSSPRVYNDQFSLEFEEILENERQRSPKRKSPFILPLDEIDMKLSSPLSFFYPTTLKKTNSRTILRHIEEIENEIRIIKNLDLDHDDRQSIHEQVDQWVEECLTSTKKNLTNLFQIEYDRLSNQTKDYAVYSNKNYQISSSPKTELMTAFYLTSMPKRTFSFIDQPIQPLTSQLITKNTKPIRECPF